MTNLIDDYAAIHRRQLELKGVPPLEGVARVKLEIAYDDLARGISMPAGTTLEVVNRHGHDGTICVKLGSQQFWMPGHLVKPA